MPFNYQTIHVINHRQPSILQLGGVDTIIICVCWSYLNMKRVVARNFGCTHHHEPVKHSLTLKLHFDAFLVHHQNWCAERAIRLPLDSLTKLAEFIGWSRWSWTNWVTWPQLLTVLHWPAIIILATPFRVTRTSANVVELRRFIPCCPVV